MSVRHSRVATKICLKITLLNFWIKLTQKGYLRTKKMKIFIEFYIFKLIKILNFIFNKQFWFLEKISKKKYTSGQKMNICIESIHFQLKLPIAIFCTKLAKMGSYFQSITDKIDTTFEICIFELFFVSKLNKQFWIFGPNLTKKDIYGQKQNK